DNHVRAARELLQQPLRVGRISGLAQHLAVAHHEGVGADGDGPRHKLGRRPGLQQGAALRQLRGRVRLDAFFVDVGHDDVVVDPERAQEFSTPRRRRSQHDSLPLSIHGPIIAHRPNPNRTANTLNRRSPSGPAGRKSDDRLQEPSAGSPLHEISQAALKGPKQSPSSPEEWFKAAPGAALTRCVRKSASARRLSDPGRARPLSAGTPLPSAGRYRSPPRTAAVRLRYRSPVSGITVTTRSCSCICAATLNAACTAAPEEIPTSRPYSRESFAIMAKASSSVTGMTPSRMSRFNTFGMKLGPMPWMRCGPAWPPDSSGEAAGSTA